MTHNQLVDLYFSLTGEQVDEEQGIVVPQCKFNVQQEGELFRGIVTLPDGSELVVQDDVEYELMEKMQRKASVELLKNGDILDFATKFLVARSLDILEDCDIKNEDDKLVYTRCNLMLEADRSCFTVKQNGHRCETVEVYDSKESYNAIFDMLMGISMPAMAFIGQEELLDNIKERYPEFEQYIQKDIDFMHDSSVSYHIRVPSPSDGERCLWIIIQQYGATVGMDGNSLCDDIGLHVDAVSKYIDAIVNEKTILIAKYKDETRLENGQYYEITWQSAPESPQDVEDHFAKKASGLGKLMNKGKIVDVFSWNGTYSMTLKL